MIPKIRQPYQSSPYKNWRLLLILVAVLAVFVTSYRSYQSAGDWALEHDVHPSGTVYYEPAEVEKYIIKRANKLELNNPIDQLVTTCDIWNRPSATDYLYFNKLHDFQRELDRYFAKVKRMDLGISDIRRQLRYGHNVCEQLKLHPQGLPGLFPSSKMLSKTMAGWVEPLNFPMRHPRICTEGNAHVLDMDYMIHDFYDMCQKLKPTSRTVLVDMGT